MDVSFDELFAATIKCLENDNQHVAVFLLRSLKTQSDQQTALLELRKKGDQVLSARVGELETQISRLLRIWSAGGPLEGEMAVLRSMMS